MRKQVQRGEGAGHRARRRGCGALDTLLGGGSRRGEVGRWGPIVVWLRQRSWDLSPRRRVRRGPASGYVAWVVLGELSRGDSQPHSCQRLPRGWNWSLPALLPPSASPSSPATPAVPSDPQTAVSRAEGSRAGWGRQQRPVQAGRHRLPHSLYSAGKEPLGQERPSLQRQETAWQGPNESGAAGSVTTRVGWPGMAHLCFPGVGAEGRQCLCLPGVPWARSSALPAPWAPCP